MASSIARSQNDPPVVARPGPTGTRVCLQMAWKIPASDVRVVHPDTVGDAGYCNRQYRKGCQLSRRNSSFVGRVFAASGKAPLFCGSRVRRLRKNSKRCHSEARCARGIPLFLRFKPREIPRFVRFTVNAHRERNDNERRLFLKLLQSHLIRPQSQRKPSGNNAEERNLNLSRHRPPGMAGNSAHEISGTRSGRV
jgi:hypothetical protein